MKLFFVALMLLVLAWLVVWTSGKKDTEISALPAPSQSVSHTESGDEQPNALLVQAMLESPDVNKISDYRHYTREQLETLIQRDGRTQVHNLIKLHAGDQGREYWARNYLAQLKHAKAQGMETCLLVAFPEYNHPDAKQNRAILGKQLQKEAQRTIGLIIADYAKNGADKRSLARTELHMLWEDSYLPEIQRRFEGDISLQKQSPTGNPMRQCELIITYYEVALNLPIPERYRILKELMLKHHNIVWI